MSSQKLIPVQKALIGNHTCPHDEGRCGSKTVSYQLLGKKGSNEGRYFLFICAKSHSWKEPIIEE